MRNVTIMTFLTFAMCKLMQTSEAHAETSPEAPIMCVGTRNFAGTMSNEAFQPRASKFNLINSYWLSVLSYNLYAEEEELLAELNRWGFIDTANDTSDNHLTFVSENRSLKIGFSQFSWFLPYADTQTVWAENPNMVLLGFRGTTPTKTADVVTNLRGFPHPTRTVGKVNKGYWSALEIVWDDLYKKALKMRQRDFQARTDVLNRLSLLEGETLDRELANLTDWTISLEGKQNFLKLWKAWKNDSTLIAQEKFDDLLRFLSVHWRTQQKPIWITGHSMGGGLAQLATARLLLRDFNVAGVYTFGSPRVGDANFQDFMREQTEQAGISEQVVRFQNNLDLIPRLPVTNQEQWIHIGKLKHFPKSEGKVELWTNPQDLAGLPRYMSELPNDRVSEWFTDHSATRYVRNIEDLVFNEVAHCD